MLNVLTAFVLLYNTNVQHVHTTLRADELDAIARVVCAEAAMEPPFAKYVVAATIRNRSRILNTPAVDIAYSAAYSGSRNTYAINNPEKWAPSDWITAQEATRAIFSQQKDRLMWITHFHDDYDDLSWSRGVSPCMVVGGLLFYDNIWAQPPEPTRRPGYCAP